MTYQSCWWDVWDVEIFMIPDDVEEISGNSGGSFSWQLPDNAQGILGEEISKYPEHAESISVTKVYARGD